MNPITPKIRTKTNEETGEDQNGGDDLLKTVSFLKYLILQDPRDGDLSEEERATKLQ